MNIPRIVVAGTGSNVGKTTVVVGLIGALRARGLRVAPFKCGPDYLDPTYHARVAGAPCHNLDSWMMGKEAALGTFIHASAGADLAVIEGVMGLYDGASPVGEEGSTAQMAKWLTAPVVLVVDASGMARSIAALARGFADFDRDLQLGGLIANRVGSRGHLDILRRAVQGIPVAGGLPREPALGFPERHLGLRTADQETLPERLLAGWSARVADWIDVDRLVELARAAPALPSAEPTRRPAASTRARCRIGLAFDEAFHFYYEDNLRRLEALGAELTRFSPLHDARLPDVDGLYLGGGYPEVHAAALAANSTMLADVAAFAGRDRPIYAECGGLMYLAAGIRTLDGALHPMAGVIPGQAIMRDRLCALGYCEIETQARSLLGPAGVRFRGHQFRYSDLDGVPERVERIYRVRRRRGGEPFVEGYRVGSVLASYVHAHWASNPLVADNLVAACERSRAA